MKPGTCVVAIDAGTTGVRSKAVFIDGRKPVSSYREFTQHFPTPGWVEHDAAEIWHVAAATLKDVIDLVGLANVASIGITNQRETAVAWSTSTGEPFGNAIVWQDRRTTDRCAEIGDAGHLEMVRSATGLVLDPYFSGTKFEWILNERGLRSRSDVALGTVDSWLLWNLTGGRVHATDVTNASRTMLFDIRERKWAPALCDLLNVPNWMLPEVRPSSGRFGVTSGVPGVAGGIPIAGVAGDQQAALFGQACVRPGMAKNTYGTGSFLLLNVGTECPPPTDGMLTTIAWELGDGTVAYALEAAIFVTGAGVQWLRDGLGLIDNAADIGPLACSVPDSGGLFIVPAFTGLGSPWWDPCARGTIVGITNTTTRAHFARAVVDAIAFQTRDALDAMVAVSGIDITDLRVDGGASVMDFMLQMQADQLGVTVRRPADQETTALGAAFLAGLAEGVWADLESISVMWQQDVTFHPEPDHTVADLAHAQWLRALARSRNWDVSHGATAPAVGQ